MTAPDLISAIQLVGIAGIGGFVLNMINLWQDSKKPKFKRAKKDLTYWIFFIFWPCAGAWLAWLYILDGSSLRPLLAFSIGLSAPTTLQAMTAKAAIDSESLPKKET
nr:hypothetical protein [uncultured Duganella sp.]